MASPSAAGTGPRHALLLALGFLGTLAVAQVVVGPDPSAEPPASAESRVAVLGDSLSRVGALTLAQVLEYVADDSCPSLFFDGCKNGMHLGDHFARAVRAADEGARGVLIELNVYIFNERLQLGTPRPRHVVTRDHDLVAPLYSAASPRLWYALFRQAGIDTLLGKALADHSSLYDRGDAYRSNLRRVIGRQILGHFSKDRIDPNVRAASDADRDRSQQQFLSKNFRDKELEAGIDNLVLDELLRWIRDDAPRSVGFAFFVPPLNRAEFERLAPGRFADFQDWIAAVREQAAAFDVPLLDYSRFFDDASLFKDYGHLKSVETMMLWAEPLLADVRELDWCAENGAR